MVSAIVLSAAENEHSDGKELEAKDCRLRVIVRIARKDIHISEIIFIYHRMVLGIAGHALAIVCASEDNQEAGDPCQN